MKRRDADPALAAGSALASLGAARAGPARPDRARPVGRVQRAGQRSSASRSSGAQHALRPLNARGGINGRLIELRTLDDGYEPDRCDANTEKLIDDDVFALFGYVGTPTCLAALPLVTDGEDAVLRPVHRRRGVARRRSTSYVFHVRASYYDETARSSSS